MKLFVWDNNEFYGEDQKRVVVLASSETEARQLAEHKCTEQRDWSGLDLVQGPPDEFEVTQNAVILF